MEIKFSGDVATFIFPGAMFGQVASIWLFVQEVIDAGEKAKKHQEAEELRREEMAWDRLICSPGGYL